MREEKVDKNGILTADLVFATPSAAAAFVAGYSVNGLQAWHIEKHKTLRDYIETKDGK